MPYHELDQEGREWERILMESGGNPSVANQRYWREMDGMVPKPLPQPERPSPMYVAPWRRNSIGGASTWFQTIVASKWSTTFAYGYDWITNVIGVLQANYAMTGKDIPIFSGLGIVLIIGSLLLCFVEIVGVQAFGRYQELRKAATQGYGFEDSYRNVMWFYLAAGILMLILALLDLILSAVPWAVAFGWTNPIGWIIGIALSFLIEFFELEGHTRSFHATRGTNQ